MRLHSPLSQWTHSLLLVLSLYFILHYALSRQPWALPAYTISSSLGNQGPRSGVQWFYVYAAILCTSDYMTQRQDRQPRVGEAGTKIAPQFSVAPKSDQSDLFFSTKDLESRMKIPDTRAHQSLEDMEYLPIELCILRFALPILHLALWDIRVFPKMYLFSLEEARVGGRENFKQTPCCVWSPTWGSISRPWGHDLRRNQESDAQLTESPRCARCFSNWFLLLVIKCTLTDTSKGVLYSTPKQVTLSQHPIWQISLWQYRHLLVVKINLHLDRSWLLTSRKLLVHCKM